MGNASWGGGNKPRQRERRLTHMPQSAQALDDWPELMEPNGYLSIDQARLDRAATPNMTASATLVRWTRFCRGKDRTTLLHLLEIFTEVRDRHRTALEDPPLHWTGETWRMAAERVDEAEGVITALRTALG